MTSGLTQPNSGHPSPTRSGGAGTPSDTLRTDPCRRTYGAFLYLHKAPGPAAGTHLCPFPEELTYRMLSLTTVQGDTVLGSSGWHRSVPAMAEAMGRVGYGPRAYGRDCTNAQSCQQKTFCLASATTATVARNFGGPSLNSGSSNSPNYWRSGSKRLSFQYSGSCERKLFPAATGLPRCGSRVRPRAR